MVNPIAFWNMSVFSDTTVFDPYGGNNLSVPLASAISNVQGKLGNAVNLSPSEGAILQSTAGTGNGFPIIGSSFYFWAWIRRPNVGTQTCWIVEAANDSGTLFAVTWDITNTVSFFSFGETALINVPSDDAWHLIVAFYDSVNDQGVLVADNSFGDLVSDFGAPSTGANDRISFGTRIDRSDSYDGILYLDAVGLAVGDNNDNKFEDILWNNGDGNEFQPPGSLAGVMSPSLM